MAARSHNTTRVPRFQIRVGRVDLVACSKSSFTDRVSAALALCPPLSVETNSEGLGRCVTKLRTCTYVYVSVGPGVETAHVTREQSRVFMFYVNAFHDSCMQAHSQLFNMLHAEIVFKLWGRN